MHKSNIKFLVNKKTMWKKTEESLIDALSHCGLRDLPEPWDKENIWIKAVVKLLKSDGIEYYAYMEKTCNNEERLKKVFGGVAAIVKIIEYYPFSYLSAEYMPVFEDKRDKKSRIEYLQKSNPDKDYSKYTVKQLNEEIVNGAIRRQLESEKIEANRTF